MSFTDWLSDPYNEYRLMVCIEGDNIGVSFINSLGDVAKYNFLKEKALEHKLWET